MPKVM